MRMLMQFMKGDIVRHLGLLDLQRTMQRALRRSGLPVAYSKGFNPHIVMSFASALSSGIPGDAELLDVSLCGDVTEEECLSAMNRVLPPALQIISRIVSGPRRASARAIPATKSLRWLWFASTT
jgi:radical SAM-linked protein